MKFAARSFPTSCENSFDVCMMWKLQLKVCENQHFLISIDMRNLIMLPWKWNHIFSSLNVPQPPLRHDSITFYHKQAWRERIFIKNSTYINKQNWVIKSFRSRLCGMEKVEFNYVWKRKSKNFWWMEKCVHASLNETRVVWVDERRMTKFISHNYSIEIVWYHNYASLISRCEWNQPKSKAHKGEKLLFWGAE